MLASQRLKPQPQVARVRSPLRTSAPLLSSRKSLCRTSLFYTRYTHLHDEDTHTQLGVVCVREAARVHKRDRTGVWAVACIARVVGGVRAHPPPGRNGRAARRTAWGGARRTGCSAERGPVLLAATCTCTESGRVRVLRFVWPPPWHSECVRVVCYVKGTCVSVSERAGVRPP